MPTHVKIDGIPGFDGEYPLDLSYFTNRELHTIKTISGVRAGQLDEAVDAGDNDVTVALVVIAAKRSGKDLPVDLVMDAKLGSCSIVVDEAEDEEDDAGRPPA